MPLPATWRSIDDRLPDQFVAQLETRIPTPCFPPREQWYRALELVEPEQVRVVVLGQDPYHGPGQAEGLAFSVASGRWPPSLVNVFKEMQSDLGCQPPFSGSLVPWAEQGVLLLNRTLTVAPGAAGSHQGLGWERLTQAIIEHLASQSQPIVYWLWGHAAQKVSSLIPDHQRVIQSPHPSPLSSYRGFFGSRPFSRTNEFLVSQGLPAIVWDAL